VGDLDEKVNTMYRLGSTIGIIPGFLLGGFLGYMIYQDTNSEYISLISGLVSFVAVKVGCGLYVASSYLSKVENSKDNSQITQETYQNHYSQLLHRMPVDGPHQLN